MSQHIKKALYAMLLLMSSFTDDMNQARNYHLYNFFFYNSFTDDINQQQRNETHKQKYPTVEQFKIVKTKRKIDNPNKHIHDISISSCLVHALK